MVSLLGACASGGGPSHKTHSTETDTAEDSAGGEAKRVCGWSDTGRWECTGPKPEKPGASKVLAPPEKKPARARKRSATPAASESKPTKKVEPTPDIVTDPVPEGDL